MNDTTAGKVLASYRGFQVLDPVLRQPICAPIDLSIHTGTVTLISGPNGVGKSSLLNATKNPKRTSVPYGGHLSVEIDSHDILHHPQVAMVQFALPLTLAEIYSWSETPIDLTHPLLHGLDLSRPWDSSSGGEKQRVILASLLSKSDSGADKILLLDEPTNHLDRASRILISKEIAKWISSNSSHRAAIVVTHDTELFKNEMPCEAFEMTGAV